MNDADIVKILAPCGLSCGKCCAFSGGEIQQGARMLADGLGENFGVYARRFASMNGIFEHYQKFRDLLDFFAEGSCSSCRDKGCLFKECKVTACAKDRKVDFCFQCTDFPCDSHGFPAPLAERWRANNEHMKAVGVEEYYNKIKDKPRYP
ncbi:MAG: DUF3795 domain-containing protein [Proteobacteria bacterium]|nr:DUF3795 domain-containing protein [Pseudomonadota bacterium]MBU1612016.1 DUF3795 domain-containing protein [Pseudomonadota bacterium]